MPRRPFRFIATCTCLLSNLLWHLSRSYLTEPSRSSIVSAFGPLDSSANYFVIQYNNFDSCIVSIITWITFVFEHNFQFKMMSCAVKKTHPFDRRRWSSPILRTKMASPTIWILQLKIRETRRPLCVRLNKQNRFRTRVYRDGLCTNFWIIALLALSFLCARTNCFWPKLT